MNTKILFGILTITLALSTQVQAVFNYSNNGDGTCTLTAYAGTGGDVIIPTNINGLKVTAIGSGAFSSSTSLTSVTIPDSVTNIGDSVFQGCSSLTNVVIPGSVTGIGQEVFAGCESLPNIAIPSSITSVGFGEFIGCWSLTNSIIASSVTNIGSEAFADCSQLNSVTVPNGVTGIANDTFIGCSSLTNVTIGTDVGIIGESAFQNCSSLIGVTIPDSVTNIVDSAFNNCTSLNSVTIGKGVTSIGDNAFVWCASLTSVYFQGNAPSSVGSSIFDGVGAPSEPVTIYCYEGTTGWGTTFANVPVVVLGFAAPRITIQPQNTLVNAYNTASLSVTVAGTPPLSYQWSFNSTNIAGATSSSLTISNVVQTNLGTYAVVISNAFGSVTSSNATLSMYPYLISPFPGLDTYWGQTNTLSVGAWGTGPLDYQWYDNGSAIDGATNSTLTLPAIQFTNSGLYSVVVSSALGSVTNTPEQVVVNPANVALQLCPNVVIQGTVGYNYIIQSTTNLADTNSWITQTNLTLTQPVQYWDDTNTDVNQPSNPRRFYRVLPGQ